MKEQLSFTLSNTGNLVHNDTVWPEVFDLQGISYIFKLKPGTTFWRFGLRLSTTSDIEFFHPKARYKQPEFSRYKDIHLAVGEWNNSTWSNPERFQLVLYNFGKDDVFYRDNNFKRLGNVEWHLQYLLETNSLYVYCSAEGIKTFEDVYPLSSEYKYFKIFAWADKFEYDISCDLLISSTPEIDHNSEAFKLNNVTFRLGDMFNPEVVAETNLILLPASDIPTVTTNISNRAAELGIPLPPQKNAGSIHVYDITRDNNYLYAGYAYSVSGFQSSSDIIERLCGNILTWILSSNRVSGVNMPLFGTGAGYLDPLEVARIFMRRFIAPAKLPPIIVSIPTFEMFQKIKQANSGSYLPQPRFSGLSKPDIIRQLEHNLGIDLYSSDYEVTPFGEITMLNLSNVNFRSGIFLKNLPSLLSLNISNQQLENFSFLYELKHLQALYLNNTRVKNYDFLYHMEDLHTLDLSFSGFSDLEQIKNLTQLKSLFIRGNGVQSITKLYKLESLEYLDVSNNRLTELDAIRNLKKLSHLTLSDNQILSLEPLQKLPLLNSLEISNNQIHEINVISKLKNLSFFKADGNPFVFHYELFLDGKENHLPIILSFLKRQAETFKKRFAPPAKVILLGNHASGKSSLLHFIQTGSLSGKMDSTHIIKIERFPKSENGIPTVIFFDFGGQDYYHGIYRAFLSGGAVYVLLWQSETNMNQQRTDSNSVITRDFSLDYWLAQKKYLEKEKFSENDESPIILVQTHADVSARNYPGGLSEYNIKGDFFLGLTETGKRTSIGSKTNQIGLEYMKSTILNLADQTRPKRKEPQWYVDFITFILLQNQTSDYRCKNIEKILPYYGRDHDNTMDALALDLDQLHKQGLILYYKNEMPDKVWLNPVALVKYIHDTILNLKLLNEKDPGIVPFNDLDKFDADIITMLVRQKVIFRHEQNQSYIIPNFLPLANNNNEFDLMTFGLTNPLFTLKFKHFLPFGLINQIICFFGALPDRKKFWRDQLLFILGNKAKILINIDFEFLEIKGYAIFDKSIEVSGQTEVVRYLFYGILGLYWNLDLLTFEDHKAFYEQNLSAHELDFNHPMYLKFQHALKFYENEACRPDDLFISLDEIYFINYKELCSETDQLQINAFRIDEKRRISGKMKTLPIYDFQSFTKTELKRPRKAVISYSKRDIKLINKFRQYLVPLADDGLMENPWFCSELIAGSSWDDVIQANFDAADIIFFMISENLMSTKYVKEHEIKNAIDRWNRDGSIMIVPILLTPYHWARKGAYDLSKFTALPYTALPVTNFPNQNMAWNYVSEAIRIMIEQKIYPGSEAFHVNPEMEQFFEKVMKLRFN
ncbi:MAG TPA: leucine-rich repeat domain-containing protein [Mucilaginibacter sp.]